MTSRIGATVFAIALCACAVGAFSDGREFRVRSTDGVMIAGEAEAKFYPPRVAVIFVPGSGVYNRDVLLGDSGGPRDLIAKDLAARMVARGVATVRADTRGVRFGAAPDAGLDKVMIGARTTITMRDDLAAVYDWSRSPDGLGAKCIVFFAHSEGMFHLARLAEMGAPAPSLIIGMGAPLESPVTVARWQFAERDAYSLELMDADKNGVVTNEEVKANWKRTPASVAEMLEPFLHPSGAWSASELAVVRAAQKQAYRIVKAEALARPDMDPYPNADQPAASYQWWKNWFLDETSAAAGLARWRAPISLHFGDKDSQVRADLQTAEALRILPEGTWKSQTYADRGHTLGDHVLFGPIDEVIANKIADEAAAIASSCQ